MTPTGPTGGSMDGQVVLGGKYVLGDILGTGGTYTVYEASRVPTAAGTEAGPPLVVKILHPHLVDDEVARAAMAREIAASDLVDHPGVSKVLDTGEDEVAGANVPWLLTRRLPGVPLSELTAGDGLPWREALTLVDGLLDALAAVHAAGLVHRDVGPRNVVVDRHDDGLAVGLLDLGLTAPGGGDGDGDLVVGSVVGMSPEQARGRPLDERSDLYAVGALTYYALTGHAPYERAEPADVLRAHVGAPVPAPSARRASVPVAVDRFVARAMAKDPAQRFASADAMRSAVATLLGTGAVANGTGATGSDPTMTLDQIAAEDPHRTAVIGAAGVAAAAAAAAGEEAELQRTRQLGAVDMPEDAAAPAAAAAAVQDPAPTSGEEPPAESAEDARQGRRRTVLIAVLAIVLAAAVGAAAFWALRDTGDGGPVAPVTHSPSPSSSPTPSESQPTTAPPPPADPTTRSTPTSDPSPTPSETPTDDSTPTPSPTDEPTEEPTDEPTSDPEPTEEPEPTSTPDPEPTEAPTQPEEQTPPSVPPPDDGTAVGGDAPEGSAEPTP